MVIKYKLWDYLKYIYMKKYTWYCYKWEWQRGNASIQSIQAICVLMWFTWKGESNWEKDRPYEIHKSADLVFLETGYYTIELGNARI